MYNSGHAFMCCILLTVDRSIMDMILQTHQSYIIMVSIDVTS